MRKSPIPPILREGFTTGSAATGAALAALILLCTGHAPKSVAVPLPPFAANSASGSLDLSIAACAHGFAPELQQDESAAQRVAYAQIQKDGGDDPDVTHKALITATVVLRDGADSAPGTTDTNAIRIEGGTGVGRVTLPGLSVPVGEAAINPVPCAQIRHALALCLGELARKGILCPPLTVIISVPDGERLARRTLNPRLGIVGGISILGTQGTTRPFSHEAWRQTIVHALSVALSANAETVCLCTGRRSESLLVPLYPQLAPQNFIQVADCVKFSLENAGKLPFTRLVWGCFFGKLLKLGQGMASTHAKDGRLNLSALADTCRAMGARCAEQIKNCTTAANALDILLADAVGIAVITSVTHDAARVAARFAGRPVVLHLFHTDGRQLCTR